MSHPAHGLGGHEQVLAELRLFLAAHLAIHRDDVGILQRRQNRHGEQAEQGSRLAVLPAHGDELPH